MLTLTVFLLWLMACSLCMAWFGAAKRRPFPYHGGTHGADAGRSFWLWTFAASCTALTVLWLWGAH